MKFYFNSLVLSRLSSLRLWGFFCFLILSLGLKAESPLQVEVTAKGAILMNADTGAVLWEKNAHTPMYPASTTKLITALYAMEKKGNCLDEVVVASRDAVSAVAPHVRRSGSAAHPPYRLEFGGSHMGIQVGEELPLRALLYGLMLSSGNDAANVIAQHVSGDISLFMEELNAFVKGKGCLNTILHTPHGLPHQEHKTTAYDLAILGREFLKQEVLKEIASTRQAVRPPTNKQPESVLCQHNALLNPGRFYYKRAIGIKTGYTVAAGYCIVTAAEDENRKLIAVLLGCDKLDQRYQDAIALFEAAFREKKVARTLFSRGFDSFTCQVEGGSAPLQAHLTQDLVLEYYPSEEPVFKTQLSWEKLPFPILAGQNVAKLQVLSSGGRLLAALPLYAIKMVESTWEHRALLAWQKAKRGIWDHVALVMASLGIFVLAGTFYISLKPRRKKK